MTTAILTALGLMVLVVLAVVLRNMLKSDNIAALMQKRAQSARLVSRADYAEGAEKIPVALSMTNDVLYYENPDLEASFELARIDEIEYDDELATGKTIDDNCRVMRLRSHGTAFEFILDKGDAAKWAAALPARRIGEATAAKAV